jgi:hypothetical protein
MAFQSMLASDPPTDWRLGAASLFLLVAALIFLIWSTILEIRYKSPYTLTATPNNQRWRRAAILALLQTGIIPLVGLVIRILDPYPDNWPTLPICGAVWIVAFALAMLFRRWDMERSIHTYHMIDTWVKQGFHKNKLRRPLSKLLMNSEQKRFFEEGFPEEPPE